MAISTQEPTTTNMPFLKEPPLIGSLPFLQKDRYGFLRAIADLGDVGGCHMGPLPFAIFNRPEYMQSLLVDHAKDFDKGWTQHQAFPGDGVFISEGQLHDRQRKIMAPSFTPKMIASYAESMVSYGERLAASWADGQEVDLTRAMGAITTSVVGKTLFDADVFDETSELGRALTIVFNHAAYKMTSPFSPPGSWPTPRNLEKDRAWRVIRGRIGRMIEERRAHPTERIDFLSRLMAARDDEGRPMSDTQLVDECVTLFSGGQETVANALCWTWYLLSTHPDLFRAAQQEIDQALGSRSPTLDDLASLPLCLKIFKETIRLYPPAPVVIRQALRDTVIESDRDPQKRYLIKKRWYVMASIYQMHRIAAHFPDPEMFDPERHFTPEAEKALPRYGFMPFGAGPRICIGNHFAMLEGHILLATIARRVTFELVSGQNLPPSSKTLTTRPDANIRMIVHRR